MANLFRAIFKNIFFAGWRVLFQHKEPDGAIGTGPGAKPGKTLKEIQEEANREKVTINLPGKITYPAKSLTRQVYGFIYLSRLLKKAAYNILRLIVVSTVKITVEGRENIPGHLPEAVIVSNHSSYLDVPVMGVAFFDNLIGLSWVVSKSNYDIWFLKWLWMFFKPIVTGGGTIQKIKNDLRSNRWAVIFPEGNEKWCPPSEAKKKLEKPSSGAAVVALSTGVTIIPVGITGADKVLPARSFKLDTRHHVTIRIGKPFSYDKVKDESISPDMLNEAREEIMNRIYSLVDYQVKDNYEDVGKEVSKSVNKELAKITSAVGKTITSIIVSALAVNLVSLLFYKLFHSVYSIGTGSALYRPYMFSLNMSGGSLLGGVNIINCIVFIIGYAVLYNAIPGKGVKKGIVFGLFVWLIGIVVPVLRIYLAVNMSLPVLIYWLTLDLSSYLIMGALTGMIYRD